LKKVRRNARKGIGLVSFPVAAHANRQGRQPHISLPMHGSQRSRWNRLLRLLKLLVDAPQTLFHPIESLSEVKAIDVRFFCLGCKLD
jgi:hypothetical protein